MAYRNRLSPARALLVLLASAGLAAPVAAQTDRTVVVGRHHLHVTVPAGYSCAVDRLEEGDMHVRLENPVWRIEINVTLGTFADPKAADPQWQHDLAISQFSDQLAQSKETDYKFKPLGSRQGTGTYFVFTDAKYRTAAELPPNEYLHMTAGVRVADGVVLVFFILSNDLLSPEYREAFALLRESFYGD